MTDVAPQIRVLVLASVALAYAAGQVGFELGGYGQIFYERKVAAWVLVTAVLVALLAAPRRHTPVPRRHLFVLAFPSVWLVLTLLRNTEFGGDFLFPVLFALGLVSCLVCLPYAGYLLVLLLQPDLLSLRGRRPWLTLIAIALLFLGAGYGIGRQNHLFFTCADFETAGDEPPANCRAVTGD
jgi:hypothetical protein